MFSFFKRKRLEQAFSKEVQATLREVLSLRSDIQKDCAEQVFEKILLMLKNIIKSSSSPHEQQKMVRSLSTALKKNRYEAIERGATNSKDLDWLVVALSESFLHANFLFQNSKVCKLTNALILGWLKSLLGSKVETAIMQLQKLAV